MDSAFIHQAANELVQNAGTRNIKQIARSCSLDISETSRIKDMLGLLSLYFDKPLILINRQLDKQTKQMVCGYALGHYLEHQLLMDLHTLNKFLTMYSIFFFSAIGLLPPSTPLSTHLTLECFFQFSFNSNKPTADHSMAIHRRLDSFSLIFYLLLILWVKTELRQNLPHITFGFQLLCFLSANKHFC